MREELSERILSRSIDKQEALRSFERLTETEKGQLMAELTRKLKSNGANEDEDQKTSPDEQNDWLRAVDQRDLNGEHRRFIAQLAAEYARFVPASRLYATRYQGYLVDQRRPFHLLKDLKALHFQITHKSAEGAYVYDVDGNRYIDIAGDLGVNIFGHRPEHIVSAVKARLDHGIPLVGNAESVFETAKLFCEITGHERVLFTQSGTEAVMWAVRIARAATRRSKIVIFEGAYHGLSDAVCAIKDQQGTSIAMAPGMLQEFADQLIVLDYGNKQQLDVIESRSEEIAGVLVEPVQSRHPYTQPVEFLKAVRELTSERRIPLLFDEMITGFRICPKGAQGHFGVKADIAMYGKIPGGGMPTGMVAGSAEYMDLVDGGTWTFDDDDSMPKQRRTLVAGTHSQNPAKIASTFAVLSEIKRRCPDAGRCDRCSCFQKELNERTKYLAGELNAFFTEKRIPIVIVHFGSLFRFRFVGSYWGITEALLYILMRMKGIETSIQGNCFLSTAHTTEDIECIVAAVKESVETLIKHDFFYEVEVNQRSATRANGHDVQEVVSGLKMTSTKAGSQIEKLRTLLKRELQNIHDRGK